MSSFPVNEFFLDDNLTETATITTVSGASSIKVHFFSEYEPLQIGEVAWEGHPPLIICKTSDVSDAEQDDAVVINSINFKIKSIENEQTGVTIIHLYK